MVNKSTKGILALIVIAAACIFAYEGCQSHEGDEKQLTEDADSFATYYYNWHFDKAVKYCTPESEQWLRYMASNVHQPDINLLRSKKEDATIEIQDISYDDDGTSATVSLNVANFLQMDTIGKVAHLVRKATFSLPMVLHDGRWKIRMDNLLRSEKQSHD